MSPPDPLPDWTASVIRCPQTGSPLRRDEPRQGWVSEGDGRVYLDIAGRPSLMRVGDEPEPEPAPATAPARKGGVARLRRIPWPNPNLNLVSDANFEKLRALVEAEHSLASPARVLIIGGGILGDGVDRLLGSTAIEVVETDVYPGERAQLLCDAQELPFADSSFDLVVIQAVLEHVFDPPRVAAEIHRVLGARGLVYSEIPFMQQVHEGPFDITRYTELGHRRLFRCFEEIDRGAVCGPGMALAWSLRYLARSLPSRSGFAVGLMGKIATLLTFWVKYVDRFVIDHPGAGDAASGTFFLGRRQEAAIEDADLIREYRGAIPVPSR